MNFGVKLALVLILIIRFLTFDNTLPEDKKVKITGRIQKEVIAYDYSQRVVLYSHSIYLDKNPRLYYGDQIIVEGVVENGYLKNAKVVSREEGRGVYALRRRFLELIKNSLPTNDAALVSGMLLGSKQSLTEKFSNTLIDSGTIHVVVASGTNVTLTAGFLILVLVQFLKRKMAITISLIGIWAYVALSGFDAPLVRAAIMGSIAFSAQALGRLNSAIEALFLSAIGMLIFSPVWLLDVGFQLSFFATLTLILFEAFIYNKLYFIPVLIRQDLSTSIAAQIGVAPLLLHYFGRLSMLSPVVNMFVLWTVPFIMILGSLCLFISILSPKIGSLLFVSVIPFTQSFILVINFFS